MEDITKTSIIDTLSLNLGDKLAPVYRNDFMVQYNYINSLEFLITAKMNDFLQSGDFSYYVQANALKRQKQESLNRSK